MDVWIDLDGQLRQDLGVRGMIAPYACGRCGHVHDTAKVKVVARYTDCSMWHCPKCDALQDDRTGFTGPGQARRIDSR